MTKSTVRQFHCRVDAVLSQNFAQHGINLHKTNPTALYQTGNQPDVTHRCIVNLILAIIVFSFITTLFR
jgi:hypothetical protein